MSGLDSFPVNPQRPIAALAFDYGTRRIGVAFGQSISGTARAVCVLKAQEGVPDWRQVKKLIVDWHPNALVVGLPFNLDGSESELLVRATRFGHRLHSRFTIPCYGMDERLSSRAAIDQIVGQGGGSRKKQAIDHIAARIILEDWFSELVSGSGPVVSSLD